MAARGKRKKTENQLLVALRHVAVAQRAAGSIEQTFCQIRQNRAVASNGVISASHPVQEDMQVSPHTYMLADALNSAPGAVNLTQLAEERLSVRSGDFQAIVPCLPLGKLPDVFPDPPVALCDERFRVALERAGVLANENAPKLVQACLQLREGSIVSSDGNVILEAWHGLPMPRMIAPKAFVTALAKIPLKLARMGGSTDSMTLWFENEAWLKTQLYAPDSELPDLDFFLNMPTTPVPTPKGLFDVARRLQPFAEDGRICFTSDGARVTNQTLLTDATNELAGVPPGASFAIKSLLQIEPHAQTIHFCADAARKVTLFYGDNVRGAISTDVL